MSGRNLYQLRSEYLQVTRRPALALSVLPDIIGNIYVLVTLLRNI